MGDYIWQCSEIIYGSEIRNSPGLFVGPYELLEVERGLTACKINALPATHCPIACLQEESNYLKIFLAPFMIINPSLIIVDLSIAGFCTVM